MGKTILISLSLFIAIDLSLYKFLPTCVGWENLTVKPIKPKKSYLRMASQMLAITPSEDKLESKEFPVRYQDEAFTSRAKFGLQSLHQHPYCISSTGTRSKSTYVQWNHCTSRMRSQPQMRKDE